jgi:hypothetical protein
MCDVFGILNCICTVTDRHNRADIFPVCLEIHPRCEKKVSLEPHPGDGGDIFLEVLVFTRIKWCRRNPE